MGLLSFLSNSSKTHDVERDDEQLVKLFLKHLKTYSIREQLSKSFNFANIDKAILNFEETKNTLNKIKKTIAEDIHTLNTEKILVDDIVSEFARMEANPDLGDLHDTALEAADKEAALRQIFREMESIIELELKTIKVLTEQDCDRKDLLLKLFTLIFHKEAAANALFNPNKYYQEDKKKHKQIMAAARSMILGQKVQVIVKTQADVFAEIMFKKLKLETRNKYHTLALDIFQALSERARWERIETDELIGRIEKYMKSVDLMRTIVKKLRPKFTTDEVDGTIDAFRKAYSDEYFEGIWVDMARKKVPW